MRYKKCGGRADVGSELSAASGRRSETSEWPRSKFQASAARQRKNFGHHNRIVGPYGGGYKGYSKTGRRGRRPLRMRYKKCRWAGRCRHRPLRKRNKRCGGERNPPVTASPCRGPLGKRAKWTGVRIATTSLRTGLAMTHYKERGAWSAAG